MRRLCTFQTGARSIRWRATAEAFRDYLKANYRPTISTYRAIADDPDRVAALDRDLVDLALRFDVGTDSTALPWEYLLLTARKSA